MYRQIVASNLRLRPNHVAYVITFAAILFFAVLSVQRHNAFLTTAFDLGNYDQAVWNTAHGRFFQMTNIPEVSIRLAHHVEPILLLLAPLYWLWSDPRVLLIVQAGVVMAGALPAYWLARRHLDDAWAALAFPLAWVLFPALEHALLFDFHAVTLAAGLLLFAFNWLDEERDLPFLVVALLAAWTKEEIGLLVAMMGLYAAIVQRRRWFGLGVVLFGAGWSLLAFEVIIPYFSPEGEHVFLNYYEGLGDGLFGLLTTALTQPHRLVARALAGGAIGYLRDLLAPVALLPLLAPQVLLLAVPSLAVNLLSSFEPMRTLEGYHYPAPLVPFVVAAAVVGLGGLGRWLGDRGTGRRGDRGRESDNGFFPRSPGSRPGVVRVGALLVLAASLAYHIGHGATPLAAGFEWPRVSEHHRIGEQIIAGIPPEASVSAQWQLNPHVSRRERVYQYPDVRDAEYVLLDVTITPLRLHPNDLRRNVQEMLAGEWSVAAADDGWLLLQHGGDRRDLPDAFYDFARVEHPSPEIALDVLFGDAVRLVGVDLDETDQGVRTTYYWRREAGELEGATLQPFYFHPSTGEVLEDTTQRPLVATLWYPPERWIPGEMVRTRTLPWPVPAPYAIGVRVEAGGVPLSATNFTVEPLVQYRGDDSVTFRPGQNDPTRHRIVDGSWTLGASSEVTLARALLSTETVFGPERDYSVILQWQAGGPTPAPLSVFTQILDERGRLVAQHDGPPANGVRPMTDWHAGEIIADEHVIELPVEVPAGTYRLVVGLYDPETGERLTAPGPDNAIPITKIAYSP